MCKKMWKLFCFALLASVLPLAAFATAEETRTVSLPSAEASTLAEAVRKLPRGGVVTVTAPVTVPATTVPEVDGDILIQAEGNGALLLEGNLAFAKNTNQNVITIDLPLTANGNAILGGFNSIVFGENFTVSDTVDFYGGVKAGSAQYLTARDANRKQNAEYVTELPYSITVNNGNFGTFACGNLRAANTDMFGSVAAPLTVTVNGGYFRNRFDLAGMSFLADDATLTVNGGVFDAPIYVIGLYGHPRKNASVSSVLVASDKKYFAADGDIDIRLLGGVFNGGTIGAQENYASFTQCLRGNFTLTVGENATFAEGTVLDATQVKAYTGRNEVATLVCPDASKFTVRRFDVVNGEAVDCVEPLRIAFVGASFTEGTGTDDPLNQSFPRQFYDLCKEAGKDVAVGNYGVGAACIMDYDNGYFHYNNTLAHSLAYYESDSDYVYIMLGINDAQAVGGSSGQIPHYTEMFEAFLRLYGDLPTTQKVFSVTAMTSRLENKNRDQLDLREAAIVRPVAKKITKALAEEDDKYVYVDMYSLMYAPAGNVENYSSDKDHPNVYGYAYFASSAYDAIFNGVYEQEDFEMQDVYLSASGSLNGAGTKDDPTSSLPGALCKLAPTGTLHVIGEYSFPGKIVTPLFMKKFTLTGEGDGAVLKVEDDVIRLLSDSALTNIHLAAGGSPGALIAEWNNIEITESFTCDSQYWFIAGQMIYNDNITFTAYDSAKTSSSDRDLTVTVNGGTFSQFLGGNRRQNANSAFGTYSGNMTIRIGKGVTIKENSRNGIGGQNYLSGTVVAYVDSWPSDSVCRDHARLGSLDSADRFNEAYNTGKTVIHLGEGVDTRPIITGDFNGDGAVTIPDVLQMVRYMVQHNGSEIHEFYSMRTIGALNIVRALKKL